MSVCERVCVCEQQCIGECTNTPVRIEKNIKKHNLLICWTVLASESNTIMITHTKMHLTYATISGESTEQVVYQQLLITIA